ncbi:hypothetical protein [Tychonema sp. BBK16]
MPIIQYGLDKLKVPILKGNLYQFRLRRNHIEETAVPCPYN